MNFRLKEIVLSIASGITINHSSKGTYPVYGSTGIIGYTNSNDYSGERILIARVGANAGATNIVCGEYGVSDNTLVITVDSEYETKYIYYFLKHKKLNQFVFGSGQPLITGSLLKNISLYIPDRISQQHIAEALSDVDDMISSLEKLIAKYKSIKTACLQQMFPQNGETVPRMRLPGFTGAWEQRKLGELSSLITKGTTPLDKNNSGIVNFVKIESIDESSGDITITQRISIDEHNGYLRRSQLKENDILFSIAGTLGRVTSVKSSILPANTNQALAIIRLKEGCLDYVKTYLKGKAVAEFIKKNPTIGAQPNLSLEQVANLEIAIPSVSEQVKIGNYFEKLDNLITLHQRIKIFFTGDYHDKKNK